MELIERKIGETFEFEGKKIEVKAASSDECDGCFFNTKCTLKSRKLSGECDRDWRNDRKSVIFVEVQPQGQAEQPQELNLCEILKHCPKGEKFWSPMFGDVVYYGIIKGEIGVTVASGVTMIINTDGTLTINEVTSPEVMLYPSREQRDWTKVKYEPKNERFDPKTLKAFDEVVVSNIQNNTWHIEYFSHIDERCKPYPFYCLADNFAYCIPYNDETKHLVGTRDEAPDFYKYWED